MHGTQQLIATYQHKLRHEVHSLENSQHKASVCLVESVAGLPQIWMECVRLAGISFPCATMALTHVGLLTEPHLSRNNML